MKVTIYFITSNHAFIGGYIGTLIFLSLVCKLFNCKKNDLMILYLPNMLLLYSILKIGCYINGCCNGKIFIPIQIVESILNFIAYIYTIYLILNNKNKIYIVSNSILLFGLLRLILSIFRIYYSSYTFIIVEIICLFIITYSFIYKKKNKVHINYFLISSRNL